VFIGGGVGITPLYSMLLTMKGREDVRPVTVFYANRQWDGVICASNSPSSRHSRHRCEWYTSSSSRPMAGPASTGGSAPR